MRLYLSTLLALIMASAGHFVFLGQLDLAPSFSPSPCGATQQLFLPLIAKAQPMAQVTTLENLEQIIRRDAAFPFDAIVTQVFTNTVNVKQVGSRTITHDVALPEHIKAEDVTVGMPVRLGQMSGRTTVLAIFEQFADPESFNYAGVGGKVPGKATINSVRAMKDGWHITWGKMNYATKYLLYVNNTADADSPELVATIPVSDPNKGSYEYIAGYPALDDPFRYFALMACNGILEGDLSLWITDETPPLNPAWVSHSFQPDGHHFSFSHSNIADVGEFILYANTSASAIGAVEVARSVSLAAIVAYAGSGDYFGIQAVDYSGFNKSAIIWSVLHDPTPAVPSPFDANLLEAGGYACNWTGDTARAAAYELWAATSAAGAGAIQVWKGSALTSPVHQLTNYKYYRIRAQGHDLTFSAYSAWETDTNPPPIPLVVTTAEIRSVSISLSPSDTSHVAVGFSHYKFERAESAAGLAAVTLDTHATYSSFPRIISQTTGITRFFRLTPYDWAGNAGPPSAWTVATPSEAGATVQDRFDGYGGPAFNSQETLYWLKIASFEAPEVWTPWYGTTLTETATIKEGSQAIKSSVITNIGVPGWAAGFTRTYSPALDLSADGRFTGADYISLHMYVGALPVTGVTFRFKTTTNDFYQVTAVQLPTAVGWFDFIRQKSNFSVQGSPSWSNITQVEVAYWTSNPTGNFVILDDLRVQKGDPDNAAFPNETGRAWDFAESITPGGWQLQAKWRIYEGNRTGEPKKPFSLGQILHNTTPTRWFLAHKPLGLMVISGTIQTGVLHRQNGVSGLAFFVSNVSAGQWTMYVLEADNVTDLLSLVKWVAGTRTVLATAPLGFAFVSGSSANTIWLGVDFTEFDTDPGRLKIYASALEGNVIQAVNLKLAWRDTSLPSGGTVGLLSYETNCRFVNFTAGSPAHAEVADVAKALDGPIIGGEVRRVGYDLATNRFHYTDDGETFGSVDSATASNADMVDNFHASAANVANTAAVRDSAGDINARLFKPEYTGGVGAFNYVNIQNAVGLSDNYIRAASLAEFRARLGHGLVLLGDIITGGSGWVSIAGLSLNSYRTVFIIGYALSTKPTVTTTAINIRFNSDATGVYYDTHATGTAAGTMITGALQGQPQGAIGAQNAMGYQAHSQFFCMLPYPPAGVYRSWLGLSFALGGSSAYMQMRGGMWANSAANITRIDIFDNTAPSGNLAAGSRAMFYGIPF